MPVTTAARGLACSLATAAVLGAAPAAAAIQPAGPARTLNATAPCSQSAPDVAALAGGGFVTAWTGELADGARGIGARLLGPTGAPVGEELKLRAASAPELQFGMPLVAPSGDGFVAAWAEVDNVHLEIRLMIQLFGRDGAPRSQATRAASSSLTTLLLYDLATDAQGRPAVVWSSFDAFVFLRLFDADLDPQTPSIEVARFDDAPFRVPGQPAVTIHPDGDLLVAWDEANLTIFPGPMPVNFHTVRGRLFDRDDGTPRGKAFTIHEQFSGGSPRSLAPAAASLPGAGYVVAWAGLTPEGEEDPTVQARLLDLSGGPLGAAFAVDDGPRNEVHDPDLAVLPDGSFAIAWWAWLRLPGLFDPLPPPEFFEQRRGMLRVFDRDGEPLGPVTGLAGTDLERRQTRTAVAADDAGRLVAAWREADPPSPFPPPPCAEQAEILARTFTEACVPSDRRLCLGGGRFAVEVTVDDPRLAGPIPRPATTVPLTADTGAFWFSRPDNVEVAVKLLDGRRVNDHFWVFTGALSNLGHEIVVTDTVTLEERRFENRPGELVSRAATSAFFEPPPLPAGSSGTAAIAGASSEPSADAGGPRPRPGAGHPIPPPCDAEGVLCLHGGRFQVGVRWRDRRTGELRAATGVPLSDRGAYFWFARPDNVEIVFKLLDGRAANGHFWVFFGGLTDLEYTITVEDRFRHQVWDFPNPPRTLTSHADTRALPDAIPALSGPAAAPAMTRSARGDGTP